MSAVWTRRGFLRGSIVPVVAGLAGGCREDPWRDADVADSVEFPDGVIAGPRPGGVVLVVQLDHLVGTPRLGLEIARDDGFEDVAIRATIDVPDLEADVPLAVEIDAAEMQPGEVYYYRWASHRGTSRTGRFRMLRDDTDPAPIRLGVFSCQGWPAGYFGAHRGLAAERDLDLTISLGDYIYELTNDSGPGDRVDSIGADGWAETLEEYRQKYRLYRSDRDLQAAHANHGFLAVWDNHELAADIAGRTERLALADRIANGKRAFWDAQPLTPGGPSAPLHRSIRIGALVELLVLDLYSFADPIGSGGSYLGADQLAWLLDRLASSTARWKVIATSSVMMGLELGAGVPVNTNQWDGFPEERRAIVDHIRSHAIDGVVAVSGDLHTFLAAPVTTTGHADGETGLIEVSVGAISSEGLFELRPGDETTARGIEGFARERNPHLALIEILTRGYTVLEARPDELRVTLRGVETVYENTAAMRDVAQLRIPWPGKTIEVL